MYPWPVATRLWFVISPRDSTHTFISAREWPKSERAVAAHRVPAILDAAIVGFMFVDVTWDQVVHFDSNF